MEMMRMHGMMIGRGSGAVWPPSHRKISAPNASKKESAKIKSGDP